MLVVVHFRLTDTHVLLGVPPPLNSYQISESIESTFANIFAQRNLQLVLIIAKKLIFHISSGSLSHSLGRMLAIMDTKIFGDKLIIRNNFLSFTRLDK